MKRLEVLAVFLLLLLTCLASGQTKKSVGWSLGYYTDWNNSYSPSTIPWNAFTCVAYFQVIPNSDGSLQTPSDAVAQQLISEGHKRGKKVVYTVGGQGADNFTACCANGVRGKFISNLIAYMKRLGYDGIDTDWEEQFNNTEFVALHKDLRDSINKLTPVPMLTVAAEDWFPVTLSISAYVDQVNDMYYNASANQYSTQIFPAMTKAGVPKAKCGAGMGISMGNSVQMDTAICNMVINGGYGGIIQWCITKNDNGPVNMTALAAFVPVPTQVVAGTPLQLEAVSSLFVKSDMSTRTAQIGFALPASSRGALVDLSIYNCKGALVRTLAHGRTENGMQSFQFVMPGAYVARLSADSRVEAAKSFVVR